MRLAVVFGTRPCAIKMAPLIKRLKAIPAFDTYVCVTGQHEEILSQVLDVFDIQPDIHLDIMRPLQSLSDLGSRLLAEIAPVFRNIRPHWVLAHGDTSSGLMAALAAFYEKIPVAHVEAGLRTQKKYTPFPEEMNRRLIGRLADVHFAPSATAVETLLTEGIEAKNIVLTGNTVIDGLLDIQSRLTHDVPLRRQLEKDFEMLEPSRPIVLVTLHRREHFGDPLYAVAEALRILSERHPPIQIVLPLHPNPQVSDKFRHLLSACSNIFLIPPQDYLHFVFLMSRAFLILTDSGGIQEEAPALGKPVLVMREHTERPDVLRSGNAKLVGFCTETLVEETEALLMGGETYARMATAQSPYGDGHACRRIIEKMMALGEAQGLIAHQSACQEAWTPVAID